MRPAYSSLISLALISFGAVACGDDDTATPSGGASSSSSSSSSSGGSGTFAGELTIASCPQQGTLIQGKEWVSCVAGKSFTGTEPFNNQSCELRFDADGGFSYFRNGAVVLSAKKADWGNTASGTYVNNETGARRVFLASVTPELKAVEGTPRIDSINVTISGLGSKEDTIEVRYFDASVARQTYNCTITSP